MNRLFRHFIAPRYMSRSRLKCYKETLISNAKKKLICDVLFEGLLFEGILFEGNRIIEPVLRSLQDA